MAAAGAGKHIHVEKPITLDRASADAAVAATQRAGVVLAVGFSRRFHPSVVADATRTWRTAGSARVIAWSRSTPPAPDSSLPPDNWRAAPEEAPGGALTAVGVHSLDHMIEFGGRVRDVRCVTARYIRRTLR